MSQTHSSRLPRVPFQRAIRAEGKVGMRVFQAANLSLGGMFLEAAQPPFVGTRLAISLDTGDASLRLGEAEVVWRAAQQGFGLRFVSLDATGRSLVEAVVRHGGIGSPGGERIGSEAPTQPGFRPSSLASEPKTDPFLN